MEIRSPNNNRSSPIDRNYTVLRRIVFVLLLLSVCIVVFNIYSEYVNLGEQQNHGSIMNNNIIVVEEAGNGGSGGGGASTTYTVPMLTTQVAYPDNQSYEMLLEELPADLRRGNVADTDTIVVQNFAWDQLKNEVAFIVLITTCEGVYQHLPLANDYVTVYFVSAINDNLQSKPCHQAIQPGQHIIVNKTVGYGNNGLKVMAGYKAARKAANKFNIIFKMDSDCVLNIPTLHKVLNYMASQPTKSYYVGEMMMHKKFMSGMLYGISDYERKLPQETPTLVPYEDVAFGKWMNSMHDNDDDSNTQQNNQNNNFVMTRLNLAPWYYGKNKRELKYGCNWLVIHNSAWESHHSEIHQDYDCRVSVQQYNNDGNYDGTLKDFISLITRSDHRKQFITS